MNSRTENLTRQGVRDLNDRRSRPRRPLNVLVICPSCEGSGETPWGLRCPECFGARKVWIRNEDG